MSITDIIFTIIAITCGVGAVIFTGIFFVCAAIMQEQEGRANTYEDAQR